MRFDGRAFAGEIEKELRRKVAKLPRALRVVSVLVGEDPASVLYTRLKKEAAERVGIDFRVAKIGFEDSRIAVKSLMEKVGEIGAREEVDGVMVQLPLPDMLRGRTPKVIGAIPLEKDVDGLRWEESGVRPATVRAILAILDRLEVKNKRIVVVGDRGSVGRPLVHYLRERGEEVVGVNTETRGMGEVVGQGEVVISCAGQAGLIREEVVRQGLIAIDVGSPRGDMTREVYEKAAVSVEVPGGVGPVTVACLLQNALELVDKNMSLV